MKAVVLATEQRLAPFGGPVGEAPVLDRPLRATQAEALAAELLALGVG